MKATEFASYRILQPRKGKLPVVGGIPFVPGIDAIVFGVEVKTGRLIELNGDPLRRRYGARWPNELKRELERGLLTIFGVDARRRQYKLGLDGAGELTCGAEETASDVRRGRLLPVSTVSGDVEAMNGVLARAGTKAVNGEVATHLLRHLERTPKHAIAVVDALVAAGWTKLRLRESGKFAHLEEHNKNGARRKTCRFCDS